MPNDKTPDLARDCNAVAVCGTVRRDPFVPSKGPVRFEIETAGYGDHADCVPCEAWRDEATAAKDLHAGDRVAVRGAVRMSRWQDKKTKAWREATRVVVSHMWIQSGDDGETGDL